MKIPFYQIDAFTNKVFGGNPAGAVALDLIAWTTSRRPACGRSATHSCYRSWGNNYGKYSR